MGVLLWDGEGRGYCWCNNDPFKFNEWVTQIMMVKCHKRLSMPLLDTNWFSYEMVKAQYKNRLPITTCKLNKSRNANSIIRREEDQLAHVG